ncbi:glycoside hydrolase family 3 C-terminal domain-containing protein [Phototrophicus methaneseepsis]|uniref:Glycoside hydrolase family 3 C-terminal domain-containing protein n=1 Tax=Phototrophicus methaneseepsis TaxID=2710758 RepID=A0A7S8ECT6_9CHLR|nr:glycoside hydrolase family 3 N-terminal domain-containing protein [Phototrophicus methaneseepsis]QPC84576.1 glycoside hydrolase family 3 C-terminal domain-containing protein [Phototrophicus methaneseepsis]
MSNAIYLDSSKTINERVSDLIEQMTLDEKVAQLGSFWVYEVLNGVLLDPDKAAALMPHGIGQVTRVGGASNVTPKESAELNNAIQKWLLDNTRLKIPAVIHEESCSGYMANGATVFPQTIGVASTWDPELTEAMGEIIRRQMRAVGAHHALAPVLDVTRDARWGRMEETYGEDPYLVSRMGGAYIKGLQGEDLKSGIVATGKHFVGYGLSEGGMNWAPVHIPERELREVYLLPFEAAIRAIGLGSIMNGYHELDGVPCAANKRLLTDILRGEWGFEGTVVSDYFAVNMLEEHHHLAADKCESAKIALMSGIDIELPGTDCYGSPLKDAVESGYISMDLLDTALRRLLTQKFALGVFDHPFVDATTVTFDTLDERAVARELAQKSIVLLKNDGGLLPLSKEIGSLAVIGPNADTVRNLFGDYTYPAHIETLLESKKDNPLGMPAPKDVDVDNLEDFIPAMSILQAIKETVSAGTTVTYAKGCDVLTESRDGFAAAVEVAQQADVAVMVMGDKAGLTDDCTTGEARDRAILDLPGVQQDLVRAIYETGTPLVLVLLTGRPVTLNWIAEDVPAIVEAWFPSEEGGPAVADVLFGDVNPSGKLPVTFPQAVGQVPIFYGHRPSGGRSMWKVNYVETSSKPLYPFGYGLSYTTFAYDNLRIQAEDATAQGSVRVQVDVTNTGDRTGDEIVQLYTHTTRASVTRPIKELKGFKRVTLQPGETRTVTFEIAVKQFAYYGMDMRYVVTPGEVEVMVGASAIDLPLKDSFTIAGDETEITEKAFFTTVSVD